MIRYFISYAYQKGDTTHGYAWADITQENSITGSKDLNGIAEDMKKSEKFTSVVILYWRRYEDPE